MGLQNPVFQKEFVFHLNMSGEKHCSDTLVFRVYKGTKPSKGKFIGSVVLPLDEADMFGVMKIDETGVSDLFFFKAVLPII